ncbi:hypothetical protein CDAR_386971 [Caerostris darwini]|uniref:Uncharacterized protein n=1 Tax=Caerostris darwini TaxID=1538125 RepID=A0AAV4WPT5_9ARAC|nr:hypothetical protein CDAR_386971 [Caerostris darwini]
MTWFRQIGNTKLPQHRENKKELEPNCPDTANRPTIARRACGGHFFHQPHVLHIRTFIFFPSSPGSKKDANEAVSDKYTTKKDLGNELEELHRTIL